MADVCAYGRWLRTQRQRVVPRLTQADLARRVGVSANYISRIEKMGTGDTSQPINNPSADKVDAIARELERFVGGSLVNEARRVIGYPELRSEAAGPEPVPREGGEPPDAAEVMSVVQKLLEPGNAEKIPLVRTLLDFTSRKVEVARPVLEAIAADPRPRRWAVNA